jgi:acyl dehydratase
VAPPPYFYEDVEVGFRFTTSGRTLTEADLVNFAGVSGDFNPLYTDAEHAAGTVFGQRVAHGTLVLSLAAGLRQRTMLFDGTLLGLLEIRSWRFVKPVAIGDTITVDVSVTDLQETSNAERGVMTQLLEVHNQRDELVAAGELIALLRRRNR